MNLSKSPRRSNFYVFSISFLFNWISYILFKKNLLLMSYGLLKYLQNIWSCFYSLVRISFFLFSIIFQTFIEIGCFTMLKKLTIVSSVRRYVFNSGYHLHPTKETHYANYSLENLPIVRNHHPTSKSRGNST